MATKNPRLNVVLDPAIYTAIQELAERDGISLSLKARDLLKEALEYCEDAYCVETAEKRERTFNRKTALTHKDLWA